MFVCPQNVHAENLTPKLTVSGGRALGGEQVIRVEPLGRDQCLYERQERACFSPFRHVRLQPEDSSLQARKQSHQTPRLPVCQHLDPELTSLQDCEK